MEALAALLYFEGLIILKIPEEAEHRNVKVHHTTNRVTQKNIRDKQYIRCLLLKYTTCRFNLVLDDNLKSTHGCYIHINSCL